MSYILDALKKADSERQLGSIPSIYAAALPPTVAADDASARHTWWPWLLAINALAIAAVALAWFSLHQPSPVATRATSTATPIAPSATVAPAAPVAPPAIVAPTIEPPPAKPAPPQNKLASDLQQTPSASAPMLPPLPLQSPAPQMAKLPTQLPSAVQPTVDDKPVGTLRDLPPNIQREIPAVNVNGYIYAVNPADRSVLINNKLLHEGEQVEPGLILEKLTPKGAVLNFKGYRFRVPY